MDVLNGFSLCWGWHGGCSVIIWYAYHFLRCRIAASLISSRCFTFRRFYGCSFSHCVKGMHGRGSHDGKCCSFTVAHSRRLNVQDVHGRESKGDSFHFTVLMRRGGRLCLRSRSLRRVGSRHSHWGECSTSWSHFGHSLQWIQRQGCMRQGVTWGS